MPLPMQLLQSTPLGMPGGSELRDPPTVSAADLPVADVGPTTPDPVTVPRPLAIGVDGGIQAARESKKMEILTSGTKDLDRFLQNVEQAKGQIESKLFGPGGVVEQRAQATGNAESAIQGAADIQAGVAQRAAELKQQKLQEDMAWRQKILQQQEQAQRTAENEFGTMLEKMRSAARKQVDPNRFWHSRDTGQKVAITIGMILHDIGAGLTGSNRRGIDILNGLIERDIDAQRQDITAAQQQVEIEKFGYTSKQDFAAKRAAMEDARRIVALETIDQQIDINAAMSADEVIQQQAKNARADLQIRQAEVAERATTELSSSKLQALGIIGGALESRARLALSSLSGEAAKAPSTQIVNEYIAVRKAQEDIEKLDALFKSTDFKAAVEQLWPGTKADNYAQFREQFITRYVKAATGAQMTRYELERLTKQIPSNWTMRARGEPMINMMRQGMNDAMSILREAAQLSGTPLPSTAPVSDVLGGSEEY